MLARVFSAALVGVEAALVRVEVDVTRGRPAFTTVGLSDSAIRESRERVRTAIRNADFAFPPIASPSTSRPPICGRKARGSICQSRSAS